MAELRRNGPYVWVTWLTRLFVGENSCEWAAWFRAQHDSRSWTRVASGFDLAGWQMAHTSGINENRRSWEVLGYTVYAENQNGFSLKRKSTTLGGKPDLIARKSRSGSIIDVKTGRDGPSHVVQVMLYMYAVPRAVEPHHGVAFDGRVAYGDHEVEIPASAVDEGFIREVSESVAAGASVGAAVSGIGIGPEQAVRVSSRLPDRILCTEGSFSRESWASGIIWDCTNPKGFFVA